MADSGEIKARVVIEYDGSGIKQAKEDLASLADVAGGIGGEGGIGDALSQMGEGFAEGTKGAEGLAEAVDGLEEPLKSGEEAVSNLNDTLGEHQQAMEDVQQAVENVGAAYEDLPEPVGRAQESISAMNDSFTQSGKSIGETMASYQAFTDQFNNGSTFVPETLWNADDAAAMNESVGAVNSSFASIAPTAADADKAVAEFFGNTNDAAQKTGGIFDSVFGENGFLGGVGDSVGGFFGSIGDAVGGLAMGLNEIAMPLFAVQMLGQMASSFGSYIYNANLAAEGPNASNPASFTSQVDQLGRTTQQGSNSFATGFGAGLNPSINAWNNQNNQDGGGTDFWSGVGKFLGGTVGGGADILQVLGGSLLAGLSFGNAGMMQTGTNWENSGMQGLVNMWDAANGLPLQYPGTTQTGHASPYLQAIGMRMQGYSDYPVPAPTSDIAADWQFFQSQPYGPVSDNPVVSRYTPYGPNAYTTNQPGGWSNFTDPSVWGGIGHDIASLFNPGGGPWVDTAGPHTSVAQSQGWPDIGSMGHDISNFVGGLGQDWHNLGEWMSGGHGQTNAGGITPMSDTAMGAMPHFDMSGIASSIGSAVSSIQLPHIDLSAMGASLGGAFSGIQLPHLDMSAIGGALGGAFSGIQLPHLDLGSMASSLGGAFGGIQLPHLDLGGMASSLGGAFSGIQLPHLDLGGIGSELSGAFSSISIPSIPNIGGQISSALSGMFSGFSLPSIPDIGGMINSTLSGMFSGFSLPSIPDIGGLINSTLSGMFSGFTLPSIPNIAGDINSTIAGMFSGFSLPSIPNIAGMINSTIGGMFSGLMIPGFAGGVENYSGGPAFIAESGPELVMLPSGSSVYPLSTGGAVGDNLSPVSLGGASNGGGGGMSQSIQIHNHISIDGRELVSIIGPDIASSIRTAMGYRGY